MCNKGTGVFMPLVCREACKQGSPDCSQAGTPLPSASPKTEDNAGLTPPQPPCSRRVSYTNSHVRFSADRTTHAPLCSPEGCSQHPTAAPVRRSTYSRGQQGGSDAMLWGPLCATRSRSSPLPALPQHFLQQQRLQLEDTFAPPISSSVPSRAFCNMPAAASQQRGPACRRMSFDSLPGAPADIATFSPEVGQVLSRRPSTGLSWGGTAVGDWGDWSGPLASPSAAAGMGVGSSGGSGSAQQLHMHGFADTVAQLRARLEMAGAAAAGSSTAQGGLLHSHPSTFGRLAGVCGSSGGGEGVEEGSSRTLADSGLVAPLQGSLVSTASGDLSNLLQQLKQRLQLEQQHLQQPSALHQQQQSLAYGSSGWPAAAAAAAVPYGSASLLPGPAGAAVHAALPTASLSAHVLLGQGSCGGVGVEVGNGSVGEGGVNVASLAAAAAQQKLAELQQLEELQQQLLGEVMSLLPLI